MKKQFKKIVALLLCILMCVPFTALPISAETTAWTESAADSFAGGTGSAADPYQIATAEQLAYLAKMVNSQTGTFREKSYVLTADIFLNDIADFDNWATNAPAKSWTPIGIAGTAFKGSFDGQGYTIYGMYIADSTSNVGLFHTLTGSNSTGAVVDKGVKNLRISYSYVGGTQGGNVGGVAGEIKNGATVENCSVNMNVNVVGVDSDNDYSYGGIVGKVSACGFAIRNCSYAGDLYVNGGDAASNVGGIVGRVVSTGNASIIENCYNLGNIKATGSVWAVCGIVGRWDKEAHNITNCYNAGNITSDINWGPTCGITASNSDTWTGTISNCFNVGTITNTSEKPYARELVYNNKGLTVTVDNCYYNADSNLASGVEGATALSYSAGEFNAANMDFVEITGLDTDVWNAVAGKMPTLKNVPAEVTEYDANAQVWDGSVATEFAGGTGTQDDPYQIANGAQLAYLESLVFNQTSGYVNAYYILTADIYLNGVSNFDTWTKDTTGLNVWKPIGRKGGNPFKGYFDGNEHTVYGMYINTMDGSMCGLFGRIQGTDETNGTLTGQYVKNLNVAYSLITGNIKNANSAATIGGIVANARYGAVIENCSSSVKIDITSPYRDQNIGGVVAVLGDGASEISNCGYYGSITNTGDDTSMRGSFCGGIVGQAYNTKSANTKISECINEGNINSYIKAVGGVVGYLQNNVTVVNCVNTGNVIGNGTYTGSSGIVNCKTGGIVGEILVATLENCINVGSISSDIENSAGHLSGTECTTGTYINCFYNKDIVIAAGGTGAEGKALSVNNGEFIVDNMVEVKSAWIFKDGELPTLAGVYNPKDVVVLGAQVRQKWTEFYAGGEKIAEGQGLRFGATFTQAGKYVDNNGAFKDGYSAAIIISGAGKQYTINAVNTVEYNAETGELTFSGHLIGIDMENLDTVFTARAVIKKGDKVVMYSDAMERSVRGVAETLGYEIGANGSLCLRNS